MDIIKRQLYLVTVSSTCIHGVGLEATRELSRLDKFYVVADSGFFACDFAEKFVNEKPKRHNVRVLSCEKSEIPVITAGWIEDKAKWERPSVEAMMDRYVNDRMPHLSLGDRKLLKDFKSWAKDCEIGLLKCPEKSDGGPTKSAYTKVIDPIKETPVNSYDPAHKAVMKEHTTKPLYAEIGEEVKVDGIIVQAKPWQGRGNKCTICRLHDLTGPCFSVLCYADEREDGTSVYFDRGFVKDMEAIITRGAHIEVDTIREVLDKWKVMLGGLSKYKGLCGYAEFEIARAIVKNLESHYNRG